MKESILNYILQNTHREKLEEKSTKQVAQHFALSTESAYATLSELAKEGVITKLDPVNGDKFSCCGWIRNED